MTQTPRLALGHISPGQLQKEIAHNQALERIDMAVQPVVAGAPIQSPPASASVGDCFLVAVGATGDWAEQDHALVMLGDGGWIFLNAFEGLSVFDSSAGSTLRFVGGAWSTAALQGVLIDQDGTQVVGAQQAAVVSPAGGGTKDTQARAAIDELITALEAHGLIAAN